MVGLVFVNASSDVRLEFAVIMLVLMMGDDFGVGKIGTSLQLSPDDTIGFAATSSASCSKNVGVRLTSSQASWRHLA